MEMEDAENLSKPTGTTRIEKNPVDYDEDRVRLEYFRLCQMSNFEYNNFVYILDFNSLVSFCIT